MKKVIVFLLSICFAFGAFAQQPTTAKKMQILDKSTNAVRQWRIYVFEANKTEKVDADALVKDLEKVKGVQSAQLSPSPETKDRILVYMNLDMPLTKATDMLNVFKAHNIQIVNIAD
jgi:hypothetical protein